MSTVKFKTKLDDEKTSLYAKHYFEIEFQHISNINNNSRVDSKKYFADFEDFYYERFKCASVYWSGCRIPFHVCTFEYLYDTYKIYCLDFEKNIYLRQRERSIDLEDNMIISGSPKANLLEGLSGQYGGNPWREAVWDELWIKAIDESKMNHEKND